MTKWGDRLPVVAGLSIVVGLTLYNLLSAAFGVDPLHGAEVQSLPGGGYRVDPQSLRPLGCFVSFWMGVNWLLAGVLILIVLFWERRSLASIGLVAPGLRDLLAGLAATVLFYVVGFATAYLLPSASANPKFIAALFALPLPVRLWMEGTAWFCEEVMFRGYLIERVEELSGSTWLAVALSCLLFALAHASGYGFGYIAVVASVAAVYAALYVRQRSLPACMLVHLITDSPIVWLPLLSRVGH